jgi:hypothetical protein
MACDFNDLSHHKADHDAPIFRQPPAVCLLKAPHLPWSRELLSMHSELPLLVDSMPRGALNWNWERICRRSDLTVAFVRKHLDRLGYPLYFRILSENAAFTAADVESSLDLPWEWAQFAENTSLTVDFYLKHQTEAIEWGNIVHLDVDDMLKLADRPMHWSWAWRLATTFEQRSLILLHHVRELLSLAVT